MTITYTWRIDPLETKPIDGGLTNVVSVAHWQLTGLDDVTQATASCYGAATFGAANPESFTAYDDLTEDQVKGWILSLAAEEGQTLEQVEQSWKDKVAAGINEILNPSIVAKISPWNVVIEEEPVEETP